MFILKSLLFIVLVAVASARYELLMDTPFTQVVGPLGTSDVVFRNLNGTGLRIQYSLTYPSTVSWLTYNAEYSFHDFTCVVKEASDNGMSTQCEGAHTHVSEVGCSSTDDGTTSVSTCSLEVPTCYQGSDIYLSLLFGKNGASVVYEATAISKLAQHFDVQVGTNSYTSTGGTFVSWILPLGALSAGKAMKVVPADSYYIRGLYAATSPVDIPEPGTVCATAGLSSYRPFIEHEEDSQFAIPEFYNFVAPDETTMALAPEWMFSPSSFDFTVTMEPTQCVTEKMSVCANVDYSFAANFDLAVKVQTMASQLPAGAYIFGWSDECVNVLQQVYCSLNLRKCSGNNFVLHPCPSSCEQSKPMLDLVKTHCKSVPAFEFRDTSTKELLNNPQYAFYRELVESLESNVKSCDGCYVLPVSEPVFPAGSASLRVMWAVLAVFVMIAMF